MIKFIPFQREHLVLLRSWLNQEHLIDFWQESEDDKELEDKFIKNLPSRGIKSFIIIYDSQEIGYYYDATSPTFICDH